MMNNLFSIFDPISTNMLISNWISMLIIFLLLPMKMYMPNNQTEFILMLLYNYIMKEFKPLSQTPNMLLIMKLIFMMVLINNMMGLLPYIFTASSHLIFTLSLALPIWLSIICYACIQNTLNTLIHLIPQGTPFILMPFMVLIESVSNLIRPITLSIRLAANMIAGHLLLVLISSSVLLIPSLMMFTMMALILLSLLEIAVAFIQAYVMSILITLYSSEAFN